MNKKHLPIQYQNISRADSFKYAWRGITLVFRQELHVKIHLLFSIAAIVMSIMMPLQVIEWIAVILCIASVIGAEMMNSSIERLCDHVHPTESSTIAAVKDIASGAVLIIALCAAIIGGLIFFPHFMHILS